MNMYTVFLCVRAFCMQLPFDPQHLLLNKMVVYHEASHLIICVDLTTPLSHEPI